MTLFELLFLVYMIDGGQRQRWHECEFPHSWDNKIEHVIDKLMFEVHYG